MALGHLGRWKDALQAATKSVEADPFWTKAHFRWQEVLEGMGARKEDVRAAKARCEELQADEKKKVSGELISTAGPVGGGYPSPQKAMLYGPPPPLA